MKLSQPMKIAISHFNADTFERVPGYTTRSTTLLALEKKGLITPEPFPPGQYYDWASTRKWKLTEAGAKLTNKPQETDSA